MNRHPTKCLVDKYISNLMCISEAGAYGQPAHRLSRSLRFLSLVLKPIA